MSYGITRLQLKPSNTYICVREVAIGSDNGLLPADTKPQDIIWINVDLSLIVHLTF